MKVQRRVKLIKEGEFVAEVEVDLIIDPAGWEPYLSVEDARKLDQVRAALKAGNLREAFSLAKVYHAVPVGAA